MDGFVKRMVIEHGDLAVKINKLHNFIYDNNGHNVLTDYNQQTSQDVLNRNMTEYANCCMQLAAMKQYLKALECRLNNNGIIYDDGEYFEKVGHLPFRGSNNDIDNN